MASLIIYKHTLYLLNGFSKLLTGLMKITYVSFINQTRNICFPYLSLLEVKSLEGSKQ